jgi:hypothetical protein
MLAMAISLAQYQRDFLTPEQANTIEHDWMERHRARLGDNIMQTPRQVLMAYANDQNYTTADIDQQLNWSLWENDTQDDQEPVE